MLPKCRDCGGNPKLAHHAEYNAYAYHCEHFCGNDTHWQMSEAKARELWASNPCHGMVGGQGDPADDLRNNPVQ